MRFPPQFIDQLRTRLVLSEVINRRTRLQRKGREFTGLCPFHTEKTPSFTVNDTKGFYHCFGCGAHGDVIKFSMETEGWSYPEAIERLAESVGMPLPKLTQEQQRRIQQEASLYDVMEMACAWYQKQLLEPSGKHARDYIAKRDIPRELLASFRLGYAPDSHTALSTFLKQKGISDAVLKAAGLLVTNDQGRSYDRFRNRLMFPITDIRNRVVAFGGRILGEGQPKYLNSPETELFHKGELLYGMAYARQAAYDAKDIVVAEGYMDVIALHKAGITNAVAPLGTAVTESHLAMLWQVAQEPTLCLDGDNAGKRAMLRAAELSLPFLKPGCSLKFALLPAGMDPDDMVRAQGALALKEVLAQTTPLSEVLWMREKNSHPVNTPEQLAGLEAALKTCVERMRDATVKSHYDRFFKSKLWELQRDIRNNPAKSGRAATPAKTPLPHLPFIQQRELCEAILVATIANHPELLEDYTIEEEFNHREFCSNPLDKIRVNILEIRDFRIQSEEATLDRLTMLNALHAKGMERELALLLEGKKGFLDAFALPDAPLEVARNGWKRTLALHNMLSMEAEYQLILAELTPESEQRAFALKHHIEQLREALHIEQE